MSPVLFTSILPSSQRFQRVAQCDCLGHGRKYDAMLHDIQVSSPDLYSLSSQAHFLISTVPHCHISPYLHYPLSFYLRSFLETFSVGNEFEAHYLKQLEVLHRVGTYTLNINCRHLYNNPGTRTLYGQLKRFPQEILPLFDFVANDVFLQ